MTQACSDARNLVRGHRDSDTAAADQDAAFGPTIEDGRGDGFGKIGIIRRVPIVSSDVDRFMTQFRHHWNDFILEIEAGVVRAESDSHGNRYCTPGGSFFPVAREILGRFLVPDLRKGFKDKRVSWPVACFYTKEDLCMNRVFVYLGSTLLGCGLLIAQDNMPAQTPSNSQSWTGLLVASTCPANTAANANNMSDMTAKKTASAHETNTTYEQSVDQSDRNSTSSSSAQPMNRTTASSNDDQGWANARQVAAQMPKSCKITSDTSSYQLRLSDGRMVPFDQASNTKIHDLLQSGGRLNHQMKVFRVVVKGTMPGDEIVIDTIKM